MTNHRDQTLGPEITGIRTVTNHWDQKYPVQGLVPVLRRFLLLPPSRPAVPASPAYYAGPDGPAGPYSSTCLAGSAGFNSYTGSVFPAVGPMVGVFLHFFKSSGAQRAILMHKYELKKKVPRPAFLHEFIISSSHV